MLCDDGEHHGHAVRLPLVLVIASREMVKKAKDFKASRHH